MQLVIDNGDWQRLSSSAREELIGLLGTEAAASRARGASTAQNPKGFRWRTPFDLTPQLGRKLLRGLTRNVGQARLVPRLLRGSRRQARGGQQNRQEGTRSSHDVLLILLNPVNRDGRYDGYLPRPLCVVFSAA